TRLDPHARERLIELFRDNSRTCSIICTNPGVLRVLASGLDVEPITPQEFLASWKGVERTPTPEPPPPYPEVPGETFLRFRSAAHAHLDKTGYATVNETWRSTRRDLLDWLDTISDPDEEAVANWLKTTIAQRRDYHEAIATIDAAQSALLVGGSGWLL